MAANLDDLPQITLDIGVRIISAMSMGRCLMVIYAIDVNGEPYSIEQLILRPDPSPGDGEALPLAA